MISYSRVGGPSAAPTSVLESSLPVALPMVDVPVGLAELAPAVRHLAQEIAALKGELGKEPVVNLTLQASVYADIDNLARQVARQIAITVEPAPLPPAPPPASVLNKIVVPKIPWVWLIVSILFVQLPGLLVVYALCRG